MFPMLLNAPAMDMIPRCSFKQGAIPRTVKGHEASKNQQEESQSEKPP
jgi:hypothetical protein